MNNNKGFTLVEVMTAMVIIAVVSTALFSGFGVFERIKGRVLDRSAGSFAALNDYQLCEISLGKTGVIPDTVYSTDIAGRNFMVSRKTDPDSELQDSTSLLSKTPRTTIIIVKAETEKHVASFIFYGGSDE